jgi:hypothetical protein
MVINVIITSYYSVTFFKKYKKIGEKEAAMYVMVKRKKYW